MEKMQEINDVCKETLTILAYTNNNLIEQIPDRVFKKLLEFAANSKVDFFINTEKELDKQNISDECKDLIALLYYIYIADEHEKKNLQKIWSFNEEKYQQELREIYNPNDIFKKNIKNTKITNQDIHENNTSLLTEYKEPFFEKLKEFIFKILHIYK